MLDNKKWSQYGEEGLDIQGIVLHSTNEYEKTGQEIFDYLNNECLENRGTHFIVDTDEVIEVMPLTWKTWSTGKSKDWAFDHCISIDLCSNRNEAEYAKIQNRAIQLIKNLINQQNIVTSQIYGCIDFNSKMYCPATILDKYGSVRRFVIEEIESED